MNRIRMVSLRICSKEIERKWIQRTIELILLFLLFSIPLQAAPGPITIPNLNIQIGQSSNPKDFGINLQLLLILTVLSLAPTILVMVTSFTRIIIVFSFMRQAIGTPSMPSNQILINMALILTFYIMNPTFTKIYQEALNPYLENKITQTQALETALSPLKKFMFRQTRESDLELFLKTAGQDKPKSESDVPFHVLMSAFVLSEVKTSFQMGVVIFVPFLVIDMVVASTLMSMGMIMLPPVMVSLPFKVLLFVMADGWSLVIKSLVESFG
ncbi:MAG: flagellar type III secretion system pore protein FliP [Candidatus Wallbacteria bacterium]|nr:flagellar type III secretion system pore protein FliP [Candidatus Wallbacteria bacterium]